MRHGKKSIILGGLFSLGVGLLPAASEPLDLPTVLDRLGEESPAFLAEPRTARHYEELVDQATRGKPFPIPCFTPVSGSLAGGPSGNPADLADTTRKILETLASPPPYPASQTYPVGDWLRIHATTHPESRHAIDPWDGNRNAIPDLVERVMEAALAFYQSAGQGLGFLLPGQRADGSILPYDLYLVRLPDPIRGMTVPPVPGAGAGTRPGMILLDPGNLPGEDGLVGAVTHQLAHASLFQYSTRMPAWWHEASAVWLERQITQDLTGYREALAERLAHPDRSLASNSFTLMQGGFLWPQFLVESTGHNPFLIRTLWAEAALQPGWSLRTLIDRVLGRLNGGSFRESFLGFGLWNLYTGQRDDGRHYRYGSHFPDPGPPSIYDTYPTVARWEDTLVEPLGTRVITLEEGIPRGGLEFHFFGEDEVPWQVVALIRSPAAPHRTFFQEVPLDARNRGVLRVPWDDAERVVLLIQNLAGESSPEGRIGFTSLLDPHYPFVLSGFGARGENGQMVLEWASTREQDLLGWNIYRSADPLRGFTRINLLLLPGGGDSRETTNYLFVDDGARPGRHYFYYLEGITLEGFSQRSHIVGGRSLPAPP